MNTDDIVFGPAYDTTTAGIDHTPRIVFHVGDTTKAEQVIVTVATEPPRGGWLAGRIIPIGIGPLTEPQRDILAALGVRRNTHRQEWDVPNMLWDGFTARLRAIGAPVPALTADADMQ